MLRSLCRPVFGMAAFCAFALSSYALPIVLQDTQDIFQMTFENDDYFSINPVGATPGYSLDIYSGGESAAIAITLAMRDATNALEDLVFVFEYTSADPYFPGPHNPGDILEFSDANSFSTATVNGDGIMNGFDHLNLTLEVGPSREESFYATLTMYSDPIGPDPSAVPEPASAALFGFPLLAVGFRKLKRKIKG